MNNPGLVRATEGPRDLANQAHHAGDWQSSFAGDTPAQILAPKELHHQIRQPVVDAVVVHLDHVGPVEKRRCLGLSLEAGASARGGALIEVDELHRKDGIELKVTRPPHRAHPALGHGGLEAIPARDHSSQPDRIHLPPARRDVMHVVSTVTCCLPRCAQAEPTEGVRRSWKLALSRRRSLTRSEPRFYPGVQRR